MKYSECLSDLHACRVRCKNKTDPAEEGTEGRTVATLGAGQQFVSLLLRQGICGVIPMLLV